MAVSLKHPFTSAKADGGTATLVKPSDWNAEHTTSMETANLLGKSTSGTGSISEIPVNASLSFDVPNKTLNVVATGYDGVNYQLFTSNGTWTKPTGATMVFVRCVGGGGGGTSGYVLNYLTPSTPYVGGDGGHGGTCVESLFSAAVFGSTVSITIGSGGLGGSAVSGTSTNIGNRGGTTSFGSYVFAVGGGSSNSISLPATTNISYYHGYTQDIALYGLLSSYGGYSLSSLGSSWIYFNGSNNPLSPASGGFGSWVNSSNVPTIYRGGVGFANTTGVATTYAQTGGSSPYGELGNATITGNGGGGGTSVYVASGSGSVTSGYNGYLGGGGGGGGSVIWTSLATGTAGAGGNGGAGFVEVFSW